MEDRKEEGKIIEVKRICRECWEQERKIVPLWEIDKEDNINYHNHKMIKLKESILRELEDG